MSVRSLYHMHMKYIICKLIWAFAVHIYLKTTFFQAAPHLYLEYESPKFTYFRKNNNKKTTKKQKN